MPASDEIGPVAPPFEWAAETARWIGTFAHRLLARIAAEGIEAWTPERVAALGPRVHALLANVGFGADELQGACEKVLATVRRTLADPRGRWIFDAKHEDARSEWALSGIDDGAIVHVIVDRTFVAEGVRWIVDFKTSTHEGGEIEAFLDSEEQRYRDQVTRYGRMMQGLDERPVRVALYYPLIHGGFREIRWGAPPS
jgi:ATP-dependent exoDNAse (exonuclease V) beta subunit